VERISKTNAEKQARGEPIIWPSPQPIIVLLSPIAGSWQSPTPTPSSTRRLLDRPAIYTLGDDICGKF